MLFNLEVKNRVARYIPSDIKYVCGNSGDQLKIEFDEEWGDHETKTARFIWGGKYFDVEFTGDTVDIPVITKATAFSVGIYAGEVREGEDIISTTNAVVPCELSIRCAGVGANNGTGANYTNEARGYAVAAKTSADEAKEVLENINNSKLSTIKVDGHTLKIMG